MTSSLLLLLKGPMQSWGDESRYLSRTTSLTPSKSGVIGLLAAAQGRRRTDPVEDLVELTMAVRIDQSGSLLRDYQTAQRWQKNPDDAAKLVTRYFLTDAAFLVALESPDRALLEGLESALKTPEFPLYLGRRSCPAPAGLVQGIVDLPAVGALQSEDTWFATAAHKKERAKQVSLPIYRDAKPGEGGEPRQDVPVSFASEHRKYSWRKVAYAGEKEIENPLGSNVDPFFEAVISS